MATGAKTAARTRASTKTKTGARAKTPAKAKAAARPKPAAKTKPAARAKTATRTRTVTRAKAASKIKTGGGGGGQAGDFAMDGRDGLIQFRVRTGKVLSASGLAHSSTSVSASGGGSTPVRVSSTTTNWTTDTIFFKAGREEDSVEVVDNTAPVRTGNRVSFILARRGESTGSWYYIGLHNHESGRWGTIGKIEKRVGLHRSQKIVHKVVLAGGLLLPFVLFLGTWDFLGILIFSAFIGWVPAVIYKGNQFGKLQKRLNKDIENIVDRLKSGKSLGGLAARAR